MTPTTPNRDARRSPLFRRVPPLVLALAGAAVAVAPAAAGATERSAPRALGHQLARLATPRSSSVCSKVSAASVSSLVGYTVPPATIFTNNIKPTAANFGISAVETLCTFGSQASLSAMLKDVSLSLEITSKSLTPTEVQESLAKLSSASLKIKVTPYSGMGAPAWYFTETGAGITAQGITVWSGTRSYGASVEDNKLSMSKLASLAKLANNL